MSKGFPEDILWDSVVKNLLSSGMNLVQIAMETGFSTTELAKMMKSEYYPPWLSIIKLLDLHVARCAENHHRIGVIYVEEVE